MQVARRSELRLSVAGLEPLPRPSPAEEIALFRVAQEALNNVIKHARARAIGIQLQQDAQSITLVIADDGQGFDMTRKSLSGAYGMGTTTMRERAAAIGATLTISSTSGAGTRVAVQLPWPRTTVPIDPPAGLETSS